jgi:23S rRNA pseudouridine2604 synthase
MWNQQRKASNRVLLLNIILLLTTLLFLFDHVDAFSSSSPPEPIRLNKVFKQTHSRRQADQLISSGRITVNDEPVHSAGQRVVPFQDVVRLDGEIVGGWEAMNHLSAQNDNDSGNLNKDETVFEYIKYWKPLGVTCTTDRRIEDNLIDALQEDGCFPKSRIFPVGRLDKETSGLILMTSDGRLPNAALRGKFKQPKTYLVRANRIVSQEDVQRLRDGVVITTETQRDGNRGAPLTAPTLPCQVRQSRDNPRFLEITLVEGRNRQIRKMLQAVGNEVLTLHRKTFLRMDLDPLKGPGGWTRLSEQEMQIVAEVLDRAEEAEQERQEEAEQERDDDSDSR